MTRTKTFNHLIWLAIGMLIWGFTAPPTLAQSELPPPTTIDYTFGGQMNFSLLVGQGSPPAEAELLFRALPDGRTTRLPATIEVLAGGGYQLSARHNLSQAAIRAFSEIEYWWRIDSLETPHATFSYRDNRFEWQSITNQPNVQVYWVEGDVEFGQTAADLAQAAFDELSQFYALTDDQLAPVDIYIYPDNNALRDALWLIDREWLGGHASPEVGVAMIAIHPNNPSQARVELAALVPHELSHLLLYRRMGANYSNLPAWLDEGLATNIEQRPSGMFRQVLTNAVTSQTLLPITNLCLAFPADDASVILAYAQSSSLVAYIQQNYGTAAISNLLNGYQNGLGCAAGVQQALGISLNELEQNWQGTLLSTPEPTVPPPPSANSFALLSTAEAWLAMVVLIVLLLVGGLFLAPNRSQSHLV